MTPAGMSEQHFTSSSYFEAFGHWLFRFDSFGASHGGSFAKEHSNIRMLRLSHSGFVKSRDPLSGSRSNISLAEPSLLSCLNPSAGTIVATLNAALARANANAPHGHPQSYDHQESELNRGPLLRHEPVAVHRAETEVH